MKRYFISTILVLTFYCFSLSGQEISISENLKIAEHTYLNTGNDKLKNEIEKLISMKKGDIAVSIITGNNDTIAINGNKLYPMLSTFKFPIALTILYKVENGELSMQQQVLIKKEELLENTWSPFKEKYPDGNISISLEEAINWMIDYSDNNMTDILLRLIGGTESVQKFISDKNFIIKNDEEEMHKDWESQFINKTTPDFFTQLLKNFHEGKMLNKQHTEWLYQSMENSRTGIKRLKGKLPNVKIAQRAGTSFTNDEGITGAINNIGIIELPNKQKIYISVCIHNTSEEFAKGEEIIADIAKVTYDHYTLSSLESTNYTKRIPAQMLVAKEKNNRYGYVDSLGKIKIPYQYSFVFTDTLKTIAFVSYDGKIKAINKDSDFLFTVFNYDNGPDYESDGLFRIIDDNNNRIGFADNKGQIIIQPTYFFVRPFSDGMAAFNEGGKEETINTLDHYTQIVGGKWGYIDKKGSIVFPAIFDEAMPFQNQKAEVRIGEYTFFIQTP